MNSCREALVGLVVPRCHRPELFDSREEVLDLVPPFVYLPVVVPGHRAAPLRGNHRNRATSLHLFEQPVSVERLVPDEGPEPETLKKIRHTSKVVRLAGKHHEADQTAERVHDRNDLARQAAPRASDPLPAGPPFAPDAF